MCNEKKPSIFLGILKYIFPSFGVVFLHFCCFQFSFLVRGLSCVFGGPVRVCLHASFGKESNYV